MRLPETELEYMHCLADAAELGAKRALQEAGIMRTFLKLTEAYRLYGRGVVDRWLQEGLITGVKDGNHTSTVRIERNQIELVAKTANRITYLMKKERL